MEGKQALHDRFGRQTNRLLLSVIQPLEGNIISEAERGNSEHLYTKAKSTFTHKKLRLFRTKGYFMISQLVTKVQKLDTKLAPQPQSRRGIRILPQREPSKFFLIVLLLTQRGIESRD